MTLQCQSPDTSLGVAQRVSIYLDCQGRALGENGFQALAGGAFGATLLTAVITLFIVIIGYRLVFGHVPDVRDGVGWALRLGFVLALVTSWPAFQALVYRVAVDGPHEIASMFMSAAGLPVEEIEARVQQSYDTLRLGMGVTQDAAAQGAADASAQPPLLEPSPKTATLLVVSTLGLAGALKLAIGFLLALSPIAVMSLLFSGTVGLFNGWLRGLAGLVLSLAGVTVVTATNLLVMESELSHLRLFGFSGTSGPDQQALTTVVILFALVALIMTIAGMWMASVLKMPPAPTRPVPVTVRSEAPATVEVRSSQPVPLAATQPAQAAAQGRAVVVARALTASVYRERHFSRQAGEDRGEQAQGRSQGRQEAGPLQEGYAPRRTLGLSSRRAAGRTTLSAARRDRLA